jgi:hypothetical protein
MSPHWLNVVIERRGECGIASSLLPSKEKGPDAGERQAEVIDAHMTCSLAASRLLDRKYAT